MASAHHTLVCFETPQRLRAALADLAEALGPTRVLVVARELTKLHEEVWRGSVAQALEHWAAVAPRGEFTLVLAGAPRWYAAHATAARARAAAAKADGLALAPGRVAFAVAILLALMSGKRRNS